MGKWHSVFGKYHSVSTHFSDGLKHGLGLESALGLGITVASARPRSSNVTPGDGFVGFEKARALDDDSIAIRRQTDNELTALRVDFVRTQALDRELQSRIVDAVVAGEYPSVRETGDCQRRKGTPDRHALLSVAPASTTRSSPE